MDISGFKVEDFILNEEFKIWIYYPNKESNAFWTKVFEENPSQMTNALLAKEVLLNLGASAYELKDEESIKLWKKIELQVEDFNCEYFSKIRPIQTKLEFDKPLRERNFGFLSAFRIAGIFLLAILIAFLASHFFSNQNLSDRVAVLKKNELKVVKTVPGVKSSLTMSDGTKVLINSGSSLQFLTNFENDKRVVFLEGEAYFEVAKDSLRPFSVITGSVTTTALGTSFNISAYPSEVVNVALVEGLVKVDANLKDTSRIFLKKGESASVNVDMGKIKKQQFDSELILAWTNKKIIFQGVHLPEALRILENWFGVTFNIETKPTHEITLYGVFQDETLENILENLSYTADFNYKINKNEVNLKFN